MGINGNVLHANGSFTRVQFRRDGRASRKRRRVASAK